MKIGVFDSGMGGMTVLEEIKKVLPDEEYYYIADSENCPYGEKTDEELKRIVEKNVEELEEWGARIVVVACNTATTRCIEYLREHFSELKFVGTEPAIKLAAESGAGKILLMATPGTVAAERTKMLMEENRRPGQRIRMLACPGLADVVESGEEGEIEVKLAELLSDIVEVPDVVVLGCTHYVLIKNKIQKFFPEAKLVDGNYGVARRVREMVGKMAK